MRKRTSSVLIALGVLVAAAVVWKASGMLWHLLLVMHGRG